MSGDQRSAAMATFKETYKRLKLLGSGAFGSAYLIQHRASGLRQCAKEIHLSHMSSKEREATKAEAELLQILSHPCVVAYIDSFLEGSRLYIVMEYADGGDLATKIRDAKDDEQKFKEGAIMLIFAQLTLALEHIHGRKILHRDIKPLNIFMTKQNAVKLGDFGVARVVEGSADGAQTSIGTPYYISPEVVKREPYGMKSDLWALGCVTYELAALKVPFYANCLPAVALRICDGTPDPLPSIYTSNLRGLIFGLLEKTPERRPSLRQLLRDPGIQRCVQAVDARFFATAPRGMRSEREPAEDKSAARSENPAQPRDETRIRSQASEIDLPPAGRRTTERPGDSSRYETRRRSMQDDTPKSAADCLRDRDDDSTTCPSSRRSRGESSMSSDLRPAGKRREQIEDARDALTWAKDRDSQQDSRRRERDREDPRRRDAKEQERRRLDELERARVEAHQERMAAKQKYLRERHDDHYGDGHTQERRPSFGQASETDARSKADSFARKREEEKAHLEALEKARIQAMEDRRLAMERRRQEQRDSCDRKPSMEEPAIDESWDSTKRLQSKESAESMESAADAAELTMRPDSTLAAQRSGQQLPEAEQTQLPDEPRQAWAEPGSAPAAVSDRLAARPPRPAATAADDEDATMPRAEFLQRRKEQERAKHLEELERARLAVLEDKRLAQERKRHLEAEEMRQPQADSVPEPGEDASELELTQRPEAASAEMQAPTQKPQGTSEEMHTAPSAAEARGENDLELTKGQLLSDEEEELPAKSKLATKTGTVLLENSLCFSETQRSTMNLADAAASSEAEESEEADDVEDAEGEEEEACEGEEEEEDVEEEAEEEAEEEEEEEEAEEQSVEAEDAEELESTSVPNEKTLSRTLASSRKHEMREKFLEGQAKADAELEEACRTFETGVAQLKAETSAMSDGSPTGMDHGQSMKSLESDPFSQAKAADKKRAQMLARLEERERQRKEAQEESRRKREEDRFGSSSKLERATTADSVLAHGRAKRTAPGTMLEVGAVTLSKMNPKLSAAKTEDLRRPARNETSRAKLQMPATAFGSSGNKPSSRSASASPRDVKASTSRPARTAAAAAGGGEVTPTKAGAAAQSSQRQADSRRYHLEKVVASIYDNVDASSDEETAENTLRPEDIPALVVANATPCKSETKAQDTAAGSMSTASTQIPTSISAQSSPSGEATIDGTRRASLSSSSGNITGSKDLASYFQNLHSQRPGSRAGSRRTSFVEPDSDDEAKTGSRTSIGKAESAADAADRTVAGSEAVGIRAVANGTRLVRCQDDLEARRQDLLRKQREKTRQFLTQRRSYKAGYGATAIYDDAASASSTAAASRTRLLQEAGIVDEDGLFVDDDDAEEDDSPVRSGSGASLRAQARMSSGKSDSAASRSSRLRKAHQEIESW
eukprot:TRINITY_DN80451_c0_g1_i1.p1 TRINITY_DN80451_c0_g1~~TRINITY_DN80451_c0_g1_i1.p1  ORF type:complete len:1414 (-),score=424.63 TRINITY_DN80451_c0_g1_i1:259-4500(-)